jgi:transposase
MVTATSLLVPPSLPVEALLLGDDGATIRAVSVATDVRRPVCSEPAEHVYGRNRRTLDDLPWARFAVRLHVRGRRFFCDNPTCPRRILAERLSEIVRPSAHRAA